MLGTRFATASRSVQSRAGSRKAKANRHHIGDELTPERRQHGSIVRADGPVEDVDGNYGVPYIARDILATMEARGTISAEMRIAGDQFRENFRRAHLDEMRAADLGRVAGIGGSLDEDLRIMAAKAAVMRAIKDVGEPGGSILWNVVGLECSLKDWAIGQSWNGRPTNAAAASGMLVVTLGMLVARSKGR